jgi:hypothetical protein
MLSLAAKMASLVSALMKPCGRLMMTLSGMMSLNGRYLPMMLMWLLSMDARWSLCEKL